MVQLRYNLVLCSLLPLLVATVSAWTKKQALYELNKCQDELYESRRRLDGGADFEDEEFDVVLNDEDFEPYVRLRNGYYLAFRATAGIDIATYETYISSHNDDAASERHYLPCGCLSVDGRESCDRHYKSRILTEWSRKNIDRVRVSVYYLGRERAWFEFNGRGSTSTSFFSQERLLSSSYRDTSTSTYNYFSVMGHVQRRFFINHQYANHCPGDEGWLTILDGAEPGADDCEWTKQTEYPAFLYSGSKTKQVWNTGNTNRGDVFVVAVKFKAGFEPSSTGGNRECGSI